MAEGLKFFLHSTDDLDIVNRVVHILYTFNYYFTSVIESNLEFAHNKDKPQTMWRVRSICSNNRTEAQSVNTLHLLKNLNTWVILLKTNCQQVLKCIHDRGHHIAEDIMDQLNEKVYMTVFNLVYVQIVINIRQFPPRSTHFQKKKIQSSQIHIKHYLSTISWKHIKCFRYFKYTNPFNALIFCM